MHIVSHFPLCPRSRSLRLLMGEIQLACTYREIKPWQVGAEFMALNPAGELPVLQIKNGPILCGIYAISEHIAEELKRHPVDGL
ncbi:MAG: glutathione S-transferase family protein, partial [Pseudomonadota bacterium]